MGEKQEPEEQVDYLPPYLQDLVQHENECARVESPLHIRFGREEES